MTSMTDAQMFFYNNAGYSYDMATETPDDGRLRAARLLADAESRLKAGPYFVSIEPDDEPWDGDVPYDGPIWLVTLWSVEDESRPVLLDSIGSVACEQGDDYLRVIAAELALESIPSIRPRA